MQDAQQLTATQAAQYLGLAEKTLENWRSKADGPTYMRRGGAYFYPLADLKEWQQEKNPRGRLRAAPQAQGAENQADTRTRNHLTGTQMDDLQDLFWERLYTGPDGGLDLNLNLDPHHLAKSAKKALGFKCTKSNVDSALKTLDHRWRRQMRRASMAPESELELAPALELEPELEPELEFTLDQAGAPEADPVLLARLDDMQAALVCLASDHQEQMNALRATYAVVIRALKEMGVDPVVLNAA